MNDVQVNISLFQVRSVFNLEETDSLTSCRRCLARRGRCLRRVGIRGGCWVVSRCTGLGATIRIVVVLTSGLDKVVRIQSLWWCQLDHLATNGRADDQS